jgi:ABC-type antimicrobial peptide transport system permease subunit
LGPTYNAVSSEYFSTLGVRILEGRPILPADLGSAARVAVISEAMARAYWPGERALDRCLMLIADSVCTTVVGIAADTKVAITGVDPRFDIYVPMGERWNAGANTLIVRTRDGDDDRLVDRVRRAMQGTAPNLPYADVQTLDAMFAPEVRQWRTGATLFTLCGGLALAIASIGLYSAISYAVARRRHEFGVRMALGAQIGDVVRLVMDQGIRAALVGVAVGSTAALLLGRFIAPLLFQTSPRTPSAFALAATIIVVVAAMASFFPAWRASRVDPVAVLRGE